MTSAFLIVPALAVLAALLPLLARRRLNRPHPLVNPQGKRGARAERRARELLREVAGEDAHAMYIQLGFIGIGDDAGEGYGYLIYPHRPIVAYLPQTGHLIGEANMHLPGRQLDPGMVRRDLEILRAWRGRAGAPGDV